MCRTLKVIQNLEAYANSLKIADGRFEKIGNSGYALIVINTEKREVTSTMFKENENVEAETRYTEAEKTAAASENIVVALVSSTAVGGIKEAYPNYFADSTDFVRYLLLIDNIDLPKTKTRTISELFGFKRM